MQSNVLNAHLSALQRFRYFYPAADAERRLQEKPGEIKHIVYQLYINYCY